MKTVETYWVHDFLQTEEINGSAAEGIVTLP